MRQKTKAKSRSKGLEAAPRLITHHVVAEWFGITTACLKNWVQGREFPVPHVIICQTWFYREEDIAHKLRTGEWTHSVRFRGDQDA
jgi:hypothetical protein